jgi:hypothetical protein
MFETGLVYDIKFLIVFLCGLAVSMLATESKVHRFKPGQVQWTFKGNLQHALLQMGSKAVCPML